MMHKYRPRRFSPRVRDLQGPPQDHLMLRIAYSSRAIRKKVDLISCTVFIAESRVNTFN